MKQLQDPTDWVGLARATFDVEKPAHFTRFEHCEECAEHDQTLCQSDVDSISLEQLGQPGWNPISFCSEAGKLYYMPALIRLSLATLDDEFYLGQLLFHLEADGRGNALQQACSPSQRAFIAGFMQHLVDTFPEQLERSGYLHAVFTVYAIWAD